MVVVELFLTRDIFEPELSDTQTRLSFFAIHVSRGPFLLPNSHIV